MGRIVVVGSTNTDMVIRSERIPAPGETILGGRFLMNPGGKGANQAVAAARLGGDVRFVAKVGKDLFGEETERILQREGIHASLFVDPQEPSGTALILVDAKGENCISVAPGANGTLSPEDLVSVRKEIEDASIVLLQLETPVPTILQAAEWGARGGAVVILNPAPACPLPETIFPCLTLITPNETEAQLLTGIAVSDLESAGRAADVLHQKGVRWVVITMGTRGAFFSADGVRDLVPAKRVNAVDTTAAGDVFSGALAVALSEGKSLREALDFATSASALSVQRMGAQSSIPYRHEIV